MKILNNSFAVAFAWGEEKELLLKDILTQKTIFFFYPKDNTPWCTNENLDFTSLKSDFESLWFKLVWVSKDKIESHLKFIEGQNLKNPLISDPDLELHNYFGAYGEKNNYWKIVQGVIRSTYLVDEEGNVLKEWKNIRAKGHAERILKELKEAK